MGNDFDGDMKRMRENPKVREWWALTDSMQVRWFDFYLIFQLGCWRIGVDGGKGR